MSFPVTEPLFSFRSAVPFGSSRGVAKKSPSGNHDKEGQAAVASFRTWRGSPAFNPWPLTEVGTVTGASAGSKMNLRKNFGKPLAN